MAKRAQITLSESDVKLLNSLKEYDSEATTSGAISRAIRIAAKLQEANKGGKEIILRDSKSHREVELAIV